jgi:hypothetical protein
MKFNLTESVVRDYLRAHSGKVYCSTCVGRALGEQLPGRAISGVMAQLAERRPPFKAGRCGCGAKGLMIVVRR